MVRNNRPYYYITTNLDAARTVSTDRVWPGGTSGLSLSGAGMIIGEWDGGDVLTSHQEFTGRVSDGDEAGESHWHATHVAGTIVAAGEYAGGGTPAAAKGMAYQANLSAYDWDYDLAEMRVAAAEGLTISNHSYVWVTGWVADYLEDGLWAWVGDVAVNETVDYLFGFYDSTAWRWDQIAADYPYYLIVAAAGNDRIDTGPLTTTEDYWWMDPAKSYDWELTTLDLDPRNPDGDYDCLPRGAQVAKNVLVVGAVGDIPDGYMDPDSVLMTPFSSWGPADDGRIKPDLVANGVGLYSTMASSDTDYGSLSGTSMAAPNVTGSVALLQQHYRQTHNDSLPRAATLRALLIHTADEAGTTPGPDYSYGWGLLNTAAAAKLISWDTGNQRIIQELILNEGYGYSTTVASDGTEPLKVTIAWTDPPGTVPSPQLNPRTPVLVNDLDLRITGGQVFYPWYLDVESPAAAAIQTTDNDVDNVEQVLISTPTPGEYTVTVSHKNTLLAGVQGFSMVITGEGRPQVLVWEGDSAGVDYSGVFIRDILPVIGNVEVTYTTTFPESLSVFDAVFLSFGPPPGPQPKGTTFNNTMAEVVRTYLEEGGSLYLEGGDALGVYQAGNNTLLALLGIEFAADGYELPNPIDGLEGQPSTLTSGMSFNSSIQFNTAYIDSFVVGSGTAAFVESDYGTVAVQHTGSFGQRTFVFSYALAELEDDAPPSTQTDLLAALLDFFLGEPLPLTAVNDSAYTLEDSSVTISVLENDIDQASAPVSIAAVTHGDHGMVVINAGDTTVTYTPEADFFGPDSFTYTISNGWEVPSTARVYVSVDALNNPPQITSAATATATKDELFTYHATATDPEDDSVTFSFDNRSDWLTITGSDWVAGIPGDGVSSGSFRVIASDGQLNDYLEVTITVRSANDPPVFSSTIADTSFKEDSTLSLPLSLWFQAVEDEETPDSLLVWSITGNDGVSTTFSADSVHFSAPLNWNGVDTLSVIASDGARADTTSLIITVYPVNDAPNSFAILTPTGDSTLVITDESLGDTLTFSWESADDVDGDAVRYGALVTGDLNIVLTIGDTTVNEVRLANADIAALLETAGRSAGVSGTWIIFASDGEATTWADNEPFTLTVSAVLAIDPLAGLPEEFTLRQNYPNPFNPSTTLRFDLPREVEVSLVVVDLLGREVVRLVDETLPAGYHRVVWDGKLRQGNDAPSGVYIVRMMAPGFVRQVKMVLLR